MRVFIWESQNGIQGRNTTVYSSKNEKYNWSTGTAKHKKVCELMANRIFTENQNAQSHHLCNYK